VLSCNLVVVSAFVSCFSVHVVSGPATNPMFLSFFNENSNSCERFLCNINPGLITP
jgi:hypothetical protein